MQSSTENLTKSTPFSAVKLSERVANDLNQTSSKYSPLTLPWISKIAKIEAGSNDSYIITE